MRTARQRGQHRQCIMVGGNARHPASRDLRGKPSAASWRQRAVVVVIADGPSCMPSSLPVEACGTLHAVPLHRPP